MPGSIRRRVDTVIAMAAAVEEPRVPAEVKDAIAERAVKMGGRAELAYDLMVVGVPPILAEIAAHAVIQRKDMKRRDMWAMLLIKKFLPEKAFHAHVGLKPKRMELERLKTVGSPKPVRENVVPIKREA